MRRVVRTAATVLGVGIASVCGSARTAPAAVVVADSVANFSGTQGYDGWYYGDLPSPFTPAGFAQMTQFSASNIDLAGNGWFVNKTNYWTQVEATGQHSNGTVTSGGRTPVELWSDRRWVSTVAGVVTISGHLAKSDTTGTGDGVVGDVFVNGTLDYSQPVAAANSTDFDFSFSAPVQVGSDVDFALDPNTSDTNDATTFTATVTVPEPTSAGLVGVAAASLLHRRRRRNPAVHG